MKFESVRIAEVSTTEINVAAILAELRSDRLGGVCTFEGRVRRWTDGVGTDGLAYEVHPTMAVAELRKLVDLAASQWQGSFAVVHRSGYVGAGHLAVLCVAACPHRDDAFAACRYLIEAVKADVPIWKR